MRFSALLLILVSMQALNSFAADKPSTPQAASDAAAAAAARGQEMSVEEFLQGLSTVPDVFTRKDPFVAAAAPFEAPKTGQDEAISASAPVLERYPVAQYTVVATLLGDQYPRALMKLPSQEKGKVLIVKLKDKLGNRGGVISKITKEGVVVVQSVRSPLGFVEKTELVMKVGISGAMVSSPKSSPNSSK